MKEDVLYPLRWLHGQIYEWEQRQKRRRQAFQSVVLPLKREIKQNPKAVLLVMTPEHGNLGDHAIAMAETELLEKSETPYVEITGYQLEVLKRYDVLKLMNGRVIMVNGGGNLGTLWMDVENLQREIIQRNPQSHIMILPNTVFYEENDRGHEELRKSVQIYNQHKHLTIYAREQTSYDFMKPIYKDVRLMPDMVMSLRKDNRRMQRTGCLLCLRSDCEKTRSEEQEAIIRRQVESIFGKKVQDTDMVEGDHISLSERSMALEKKFDEFASAELVITDRLHGMIFAAITGTPCIVVNSKSPKVRGCYEWIRNLDYIRFADDVAQIVQLWEQIPSGEHHYDNAHLQKYFRELEEVVKKYAAN